MTGLVVREDLTKRTYLSKSTLKTFDLCNTKAWFDLHDPRPAIPNERMTFGSAVDAAVEQIAVFLRSGQTVDMTRVMSASLEVITRDEVAVDLDEVERAAERFVLEVAPHRDWQYVVTQESLETEFEDLGPVGGHPDLHFRDNSIDDVKTAKRAKPDEPTVELGWYALLIEEISGKSVPEVGYMTWVRTSRPYWQVLRFPVTDELRRWTRERAGAYVRAQKADVFLNRKSPTPKNYSFGGGPKFDSLCADCQFAPANGGSCAIAWRGEPNANAA